MSIFGMPVIDAHVHTGHYMNTHYRSQHLLDLVKRVELNFSLCASYTSGTVGQATGTAEMRVICERYADRIGGLVWVVPYDTGWEKDAAESLYAGFYGIFLHPAVDCYRVEPDLLRPIFQFAHDNGMPVLAQLDENNARAEFFAPLLREFSEVMLVLCDLHGWEELELLGRYQNVLFTTGTMPATAIALAVRAVGSERIMWGSGAPVAYNEPAEGEARPQQVGKGRSNLRLVQAPAPVTQQSDWIARVAGRYEKHVQAVLDLHLPEADLEALFYLNAKRVFGLDQLQI